MIAINDNVPGVGYSRKASCALNKISTFLSLVIYILVHSLNCLQKTKDGIDN